MERSAILGMLKTVFSTLTVAMRYEPANAKFFETQVKFLKLSIFIKVIKSYFSYFHLMQILIYFIYYLHMSIHSQYTVNDNN